MVDFPKRYEPVRVLGAGGMGRVELVRDRERGQDVALKAYASAGDAVEGHFLFKQEFWAMASLRHPNLVEAFDYGELADGTPYFTMEEVPGSDLAPPQDEAEVRAWLPGVAAALGFLHARGWVHGDLKPANIRMGIVPKLMDLGLLERAGRAGGPIRGTPSYMAPEIIRQGALDARTDLYALGAVLYHVLAGRPPFAAEQPLALLRAHLMDAPAPLTGTSPALAAAVLKLLAKEPAARFSSAAELMRALGLAATEEGAQLLAPPLVGRAAAQAALADLVGWQGPAARVLAGPAGSGKTRLLAELRAEAQLAGVRALAARGLGEDAAPYEAMLPWLRAIAAQPPAEAARLAPVLVKVLPELPRLWGLAVEPAPALEGAQERRRLEAVVAEVARATLPAALWLLDDADRLDPSSASLVEALRRAGGERPWRWVEARCEARAPAITLAPLTADETLAVARGLLGQAEVPAALAERLPALAGGVPGTIEALVGHWVRQGDLRGTTGHWDANPAADFALPGGLGGLEDARFEALDDHARQVARVAALLGDEGELPILARLAELPEAVFYAALAALEAAGVLAIEDDEAAARTRYRFGATGGERGWSARARRLAAGIPADEAARIHLAAATLLARDEGPEAARPLATALAIAQHRLAARAAATPWVLAAARRALGVGEVARAAGLLQRALAQSGPDLALQRMLADALRFDGRIDDAMALAADAVVPTLRASGDPALAHELATLGLLHQLQGRYDEARAAFDEAVALADAQGDVATAVRARTSLGRVAYFGGESEAAREMLARATADARAAGLVTQLAGALGLYGYLIGATDARRVDEALGVLDEAVAANQALGDAVEELEALNLRGNLLLASSRLAEAEAAFSAGLVVSQRVGLANEEIFAHLNLGAVALERGALAAARLHGRQAAMSAERQGRKFPLSFGRAVEGLARVFEGDLAGGQALLAEGLALAREINNRYVELAIQAYTAEALIELGRFAEAERALAAARELAASTGNDEQQARLARLALALAALTDAPDAEAQLAGPGVQALRWRAFWLLRQGRFDDAGQAAAEAAALANEAGLDLVEAAARLVEGRVALAAGDEQAAAEAFDAGYVLAEGRGYRALALALNHDDEGLAELAGGLEPAHEAAFLAHPERGAGRVQTGRVRQLAGLQASVSAEGGLAEVMHRAIAALVALADADRGFLFLYDGTSFTDQAFYGMSEHEADAYSGSLAFKALWSEVPIWVEDAQADAELGGSESVQALALRSVLGVPLLEGGRAIGVMLADSQRVNTRFGAQDLEIVEVLAGHVALAITQARRVERLEREKAELAAYARAAEAVVGLTALEDVFAAVATEALALTGAERALLLLGPDHTQVASHGPPGAPSASAAGWVYERGEPLHLLDASSDEAFQAAESIQALGLRTILAVPVGERQGVLYLDDRRITDRDEHVMAGLVRLGSLLATFLRRSGYPPT
ncbi:MAG: protein kinase [Cyanobacteria bacterium RYN_339]|nr:protein kinase [Cyanobacteria bacterium RYN_339]